MIKKNSVLIKKKKKIVEMEIVENIYIFSVKKKKKSGLKNVCTADGCTTAVRGKNVKPQNRWNSIMEFQ